MSHRRTIRVRASILPCLMNHHKLGCRKEWVVVGGGRNILVSSSTLFRKPPSLEIWCPPPPPPPTGGFHPGCGTAGRRRTFFKEVYISLSLVKERETGGASENEGLYSCFQPPKAVQSRSWPVNSACVFWQRRCCGCLPV